MMYILQDFGCKSEAVELKQTLSVVFDPTIASRGLQSKLSLKVQNIWAPEKIDYYPIMVLRGARWLSGRVSDSGARGPGFETYRRRVVSLSKTLYSPKVLVNYPGSDGSVPK